MPFEMPCVPQMLSMGVHLASAVATAHRAGIVHRDIKTSNVLITWQRLPTLADFGIAVTAYDHSSTGYSLPWAPPETLRTGGAGGEAADIYSLGAVLYASLVGTSPFEYGYHPKTAKELARLIMTQPLPTIQRNDVPTVVHETLAHAMAPNADDRYPSALAFARALQQAQFEMCIRDRRRPSGLHAVPGLGALMTPRRSRPGGGVAQERPTPRVGLVDSRRRQCRQCGDGILEFRG